VAIQPRTLEALTDLGITNVGVTVERGTKLTGLTQDAAQAVATLRHPDGRVEQAAVSYVAGCDGPHYSVRQHTHIPFEGGSYPPTFVLPDVDADGIEPGAAHAYLSAQGMLFFFPLVHPAAWRRCWAVRFTSGWRGNEERMDVSLAPMARSDQWPTTRHTAQ
jgi:2-polyprenyl-6-methoxyphenol hydroxylase-like FAD-dependent oxidoreductase